MTDALSQANAKAGLEPGVVPYIIIERAAEAVAFYKRPSPPRRSGSSRPRTASG